MDIAANDIIEFRAVEPNDVDFLYMLENDPTAATYPSPVSRQQLWNYAQSDSFDIYGQKQMRLIITAKADGATVGFIEIYDFDAANRRGFVGIAIAPRYRGQGYARSALDLLVWYADVAIGMHQLAAVVAVDNEPSKALFSKCFKPAGRLRSWQRSGNRYSDALIFQKLF